MTMPVTQTAQEQNAGQSLNNVLELVCIEAVMV
jgi:hypothetical protein